MSRFNHTTIMTILILLICVAIGYASWASFRNVDKIYLAEIERTISEIKEDFLKPYVANIVLTIDWIRELEEGFYEQTIDDLYAVFSYSAHLYDLQFIELFSTEMEARPYLVGHLWIGISPEGILDFDLDDLHYFRTIKHGEVTALWGVLSSFLEESTREKIKTEIEKLNLVDGSFIWIDELTNGDAFAMQFDTSEQLTYSTMYMDFNWVIGMGMHTNEIAEYRAQTGSESKKLSILLSLRLVLLLVLLVILALGVVLVVENFYFKQSTKELELEVNKDVLTGARSRRFGSDHLANAFELFRLGGVSPGIVLFDVDHLKEINDSFGHEVGDQVLKGVVDAVYRSIHGSDQVIRWGGDEFVVLLHGVDEKNLETVGAKLLSSVSSLEFKVDQASINPSISLGASYFFSGDKDFNEALNRADQALYQSKKMGRNRVSVVL